MPAQSWSRPMATAPQSYEHKGLRASTQYRYQVTAVNAIGASSVSTNIANATTSASTSGTTTAADAVQDLRAVVDNSTVSLYWNLPADQDPTEDDFTISYVVETVTSRSLPRVTSNEWGDAGGTDGGPNDLHEYRDTGVTNPVVTGQADTVGLKIHYRVRVNTEGSSWSTFTISPKVFAATPLVPGAPATGTMAIPEEPTANANGSLTQITLTWGYVGGATAGDDGEVDASGETTQRPTGYELDFVKGDDITTTTNGDRQYYASLLPESRSGYARSPITHRDLEAGTEYIYRIFPYQDEVFGAPVEVTATTEPAVAPDTRLNLRVVAEGPTKLKLTWDEPRADGGSDVTGYLIQVANDVDDNRTLDADDTNPWVSIHDFTDTDFASFVVVESDAPAPATQDEWETDDADAREYVYQNLEPNDARWFRVIALNGVATVVEAGGADTLSAEAMDAIGSAVPVRGMTARASVPVAPNGLVTEQARNSNLTGAGNRGVLLLWNAPEDPTGAVLEGYVIARKIDDGEWEDDWKKIEEGDPRTYETDSDIPATDQMNYYRVAAFNSAGTGDWSNVSLYPSDGSHVPATGTLGEVSDVVATPGADGEVTVMWMGGNNADRYFIIALEQGSDPLVIGFARAESGATEATITGLNSGESHFVVVLALKGTGDDRELEYGTDTVTVQ